MNAIDQGDYHNPTTLRIALVGESGCGNLARTIFRLSKGCNIVRVIVIIALVHLLKHNHHHHHHHHHHNHSSDSQCFFAVPLQEPLRQEYDYSATGAFL